MSRDVGYEKRIAAEAAAALAKNGMTVGLGSGSTAEYFLSALAARGLDVRCVASSPATEEAALALGLRIERFDAPEALARLDLAVDGADQVAADGWIVKGGGGAHTREKVVAAAAAQFVVVVSSDKLVERVAPPVPLELLALGVAASLERLEHAGLREAPRTPDGGVLADWNGAVDAPRELAIRLSAEPGLVEHGLFPPELVSEILVGRANDVERIPGRRRSEGT